MRLRMASRRTRVSRTRGRLLRRQLAGRCGGADVGVDVLLELGEIVAEHADELLRRFARIRPLFARSSRGRGCAARRRAPMSAPRSRNRGPCGSPPGCSEPSSAAVSSRRVTRIGMRRPTPCLPPVQPVLTSQQSTPCLRDQVAQQVAVDGGVARHERRAEAGRERRLRLGHALLRARDLGGVAGQEVVHGLRRRRAWRSAAARRRRRRSAS